jgi:hypothetical protein
VKLKPPYEQYVGKWFVRDYERSVFYVVEYLGIQSSYNGTGPIFEVVDYRMDGTKAAYIHNYSLKKETPYTPDHRDFHFLVSSLLEGVG